MLEKYLTNNDHVTTWLNVHVTWGMVFPKLSLCSVKLCIIGVVEMQREVFNFSRDHTMKQSHDLVGWVLQT